MAVRDNIAARVGFGMLHCRPHTCNNLCAVILFVSVYAAASMVHSVKRSPFFACMWPKPSQIPLRANELLPSWIAVCSLSRILVLHSSPDRTVAIFDAGYAQGICQVGTPVCRSLFTCPMTHRIEPGKSSVVVFVESTLTKTLIRLDVASTWCKDFLLR